MSNKTLMNRVLYRCMNALAMREFDRVSEVELVKLASDTLRVIRKETSVVCFHYMYGGTRR